MLTDNSPPNADVVSNGGGVNSPLSRRLPSPWASVVRGDSEQNSSPTAASAAASGTPGSSSPPPAEQASAPDNSLVESSGSESQPESSDVNGDSNAGRPRRPAWNRPSNDVVEPVSVMGGAISWPALSETTRPIQRSSSDISRSVSDGSASPSQAPIISQAPQRPAANNNNAHANSTANNPTPARPRSRNRTGGGGGGGSSSGSGPPSQNTFNQPSLPMPPPFPVFEVPYGMVPAVMDTSVRGPRPVGGSQSHSGNDHSNQRNNSRRGNYGPRPRGDGQYHNNHVGGRRDQDRRDVHHPPQYVPPPMGYLPPGAAPFMPPPPVRVFPGQMGFGDMGAPMFYVPTLPPESFRSMPIVPPPPPMHFPPVTENPLTNMIVKQIDFYFSDENLVKDNYLKQNMDPHGWVPISLIANFRRVQQLTQDIPVILEALRHSTVVEVQGDKVRRRNEWSKWINSANRVHSDLGSQAQGATSENALVNSLREVSIDDVITNANGNAEGHMEMAAGRTLPDELNAESGLANGSDSAEDARTNSV